MIEDPYKILGVSKDASQDDIKKAYRKLAKKNHPDLNPGNEAAAKKFQDISTAYEMIETPDKRKQFEEEKKQREQFSGFQSDGRKGPFYYETQNDGGRYTQAFSNMGGSSVFEDLFGGFGEFAKQKSKPKNGQDHLYNLEIEFNESITGTEKIITLSSGKQLKIKIPPGIETGKKLKFAGQGGTAPKGGKAGDAYIEIRVKGSDVFSRRGDDLEMTLPITVYEATFGGEVKVSYFDSQIKVKIPPNSNTGKKLRISAKGALNSKTQKKGDLFLILEVKLPDKVDAELERIVKQWSEKAPYNPRKGVR